MTTQSTTNKLDETLKELESVILEGERKRRELEEKLAHGELLRRWLLDDCRTYMCAEKSQRQRITDLEKALEEETRRGAVLEAKLAGQEALNEVLMEHNECAGRTEGKSLVLKLADELSEMTAVHHTAVRAVTALTKLGEEQRHTIRNLSLIVGRHQAENVLHMYDPLVPRRFPPSVQQPKVNLLLNWDGMIRRVPVMLSGPTVTGKSRTLSAMSPDNNLMDLLARHKRELALAGAFDKAPLPQKDPAKCLYWEDFIQQRNAVKELQREALRLIFGNLWYPGDADAENKAVDRWREEQEKARALGIQIHGELMHHYGDYL